MPLPRHLFAPAFRHQHLGQSFAAIVGIMVFIATFTIVGEAALLTMGYIWGQTADNRITVEIPAVGDETSTPQSERVKQASAILRALPGVGLVMPLSDEEVTRLLNPWFSQPELKILPLPTLIDVERTPNAALTAAQIQGSLKNTISDVRVDDHGEWMQDVWRLVRGLSVLGALTIGLTGIILMITVSLICRAVMSAEHETVSLLHLLGADDHDIARHFQKQAKRIALRASCLGFIVALMATTGLLFAAKSIADFSTLHLWHWVGLGLVAVAVPLCATSLAALTTRNTILRLIKSFP